MKPLKTWVGLWIGIGILGSGCGQSNEPLEIAKIDPSTDRFISPTTDTDTNSDTDTNTLQASLIDQECQDAHLTCEEDHLLACEDSVWKQRTDCAVLDQTCDHYIDQYATCLPMTTTVETLTGSLRSLRIINPAGIRVVFSVSKENGVPIAPLTKDDITIINDENDTPFSEGGGRPVLGETSNFEFFTVLALDMSDSMFVPLADERTSAAQAIEAARTFVRSRVEQPPAAQKHQVAIYAFGSTAESGFVNTDFTDEHELLYEQLDELLVHGSHGNHGRQQLHRRGLFAGRNQVHFHDFVHSERSSGKSTNTLWRDRLYTRRSDGLLDRRCFPMRRGGDRIHGHG